MRDLPYIGEDESRFTEILRMYYPEYMESKDIELSIDYPVGDDYSAIRQYLRGPGGPLVDFLVYVDLGVGWKLNPVGWEDEKEGQKAAAKTEEWMDKISFFETMNMFATFRLVLGRHCIVKTYDLNGDFYYSPREKVTGVDCIDPLTLDMNSVREVMRDRTGTVPFVQRYSGAKGEEGKTNEFSQDRVIYRTRNALTKYSTYGVSLFENTFTDLRTAAKFPRYRSDISRKYANIHRHFIVNTETLMSTPEGLKILSDPNLSKAYLDDIHTLIREQEEKSTSLATFDFITSIEQTYGGKEPDIAGVERTTYQSIGYKTGIPIELIMYTSEVDRSALEVVADLFVRRRENGDRKIVYAPIIRDIANEYAKMQGYPGKFAVEFNPFLSKDLNAIYARVGALMQQVPDIFSRVEIRREIDFPDRVVIGEADEYAREAFQQTQQAEGKAISGVPKIRQPQKDIEGKPMTPITALSQMSLNQALIDGNKIRPLYLEIPDE